jgi:hypothetical protein
MGKAAQGLWHVSRGRHGARREPYVNAPYNWRVCGFARTQDTIDQKYNLFHKFSPPYSLRPF